MTEQEPELTPAQEERVRRLLAEARHTEPMPADVAARLDAVLAGLGASNQVASSQVESSQVPGDVPTATTAPVVDLAAARRRRRRVTQALVAAAAVAVVGFAGPSMLRGVTMSGDDGSATSAGGADREMAGDVPSVQSQDDTAGEAPQAARGEAAKGPATRLGKDTFERDAARAFARVAAPGRAELTSPPTAGSSGAYAAWAGCAVDVVGQGSWVPARYAGERGWLLFRKPVDGRTRVEFYPCGADAPTRSTDLAVR